MITWEDDDFNSKAEALSKFSDSVDSYSGFLNLRVIITEILLTLNQTDPFVPDLALKIIMLSDPTKLYQTNSENY